MSDIVFGILFGVALVLFIIQKFKNEQLKKKYVLDVIEERKKAIKQSRSTIEGLVTEQLAPYFPGWKHTPSEARFIASPLDFVVFNGLSEDNVKDITFVEVKSGQSKETARQRSVKDAIKRGRVNYELVEIDMNGKQVTSEEIDAWIVDANNGKTIQEVSDKYNRSTKTILDHIGTGVFTSSRGLRKGNNIVLKDTECAWLAGIIDGEGSIGLSKIERGNKTFIAPVITITNTNKPLMDKVCAVYPNGNIYSRQRESNLKICYDWQLSKVNDVSNFLEQIFPFLAAKRDKAEVVLRFCKYRMQKKPYSDKELQFYNQLKDLDKE